MIRNLNIEDLPLLVEGGREFFDEGKIPGGFKPDYFLNVWRGFLGNGIGRVIGMWGEAELQGALGFLVHPDPHNGDFTAVECFWFVRQKYRGKGTALLTEFERQARDMGAARIAMIHLTTLHPEKLGKLYERLGYSVIETHWIKNA